MTLAEELAEKKLAKMNNCIGTSIPKRVRGCVKEFQQEAFRLALVEAVDDAIERCAQVAESGGVNVADPETAARIRALKVSQ